MPSLRLAKLMNHLTAQTVLNDLLQPAISALDSVRYRSGQFRVLDMPDFVRLGVLRHLQEMKPLRAQVQALMHLEPGFSSRAPLARSTWSDALSSSVRLQVLRALIPVLARQAREVLPDRFVAVEELGNRPIYAVDGSYQTESVHYRRRTPSQGGRDNPKGHALLTFYDLRLGCPIDLHVDTRSQHEITYLRDYDREASAITRQRNALWVVDRAFIHASFWDARKKSHRVTMITRWKKNLAINATDSLPFDATDPVNRGVQADLRLYLNSSHEAWRLVRFRTRRGRTVEFLTNEMNLKPGIIAFLYARRWDEEKVFDTWKNDFAIAKAWGLSPVAIEQQARLAIVLSILLPMVLIRRVGPRLSRDPKALDKQAARQSSQADGTDRPDWTLPWFRFTSKISRQVLRFFRACFLKPASQALYNAELKPLLMAYL